MYRSREDIATTNFEAVIDREWGLAGRVMVVGSFEGLARSWKWRVESHDAETRSARRCQYLASLWSCLLTVFLAVNNRLDWRTV